MNGIDPTVYKTCQMGIVLHIGFHFAKGIAFVVVLEIEMDADTELTTV